MTMAVPFYIPESNDASVSSTTNGEPSAASSAQNSQPNSPSRPIPIPLRNNNNLESPQLSPIDNEALVQAFYEALCRHCSQGSPISQQMSPSSTISSGQFFFPHYMMPSTSTSAYSSPRHSFRVPRQRFDFERDAEDEEEIQQHEETIDYQQRDQLEEFAGTVPEPKKKKFKQTDDNHKSHGKQNKFKITTFVIKALQFVIDTLR